MAAPPRRSLACQAWPAPWGGARGEVECGMPQAPSPGVTNATCSTSEVDYDHSWPGLIPCPHLPPPPPIPHPCQHGWTILWWSLLDVCLWSVDSKSSTTPHTITANELKLITSISKNICIALSLSKAVSCACCLNTFLAEQMGANGKGGIESIPPGVRSTDAHTVRGWGLSYSLAVQNSIKSWIL